MKALLPVLMALCLGLPAGFAAAEEKPQLRFIEKPTTAQSTEFATHANKHWQRTEAIYLPQDAALDFKAVTKVSDYRMARGTMRQLAIAVLVLFGIALVLFAVKNRMGGGLFSRRPKDHSLNHLQKGPAGKGLFDETDESYLSSAQLLALDDPRAGLRALLLQSLRRAADQNNIALRRSLTARDVLALVPGSWPSRGQLVQLVGTAEVVLFGGNDISRDQFATAVRNAEPLLGEGAVS